MEAMTLPSPGNIGLAPVWENYVIAQTVAASRGLISAHALALGVEVDDSRLRLRFQLSEVTDEDGDGMNEIVTELEGLLGNDVEVESSYEVADQRQISPIDGVNWIFLARALGRATRRLSCGHAAGSGVVQWLARPVDGCASRLCLKRSLLR